MKKYKFDSTGIIADFFISKQKEFTVKDDPSHNEEAVKINIMLDNRQIIPVLFISSSSVNSVLVKARIFPFAIPPETAASLLFVCNELNTTSSPLNFFIDKNYKLYVQYKFLSVTSDDNLKECIIFILDEIEKNLNVNYNKFINILTKENYMQKKGRILNISDYGQKIELLDGSVYNIDIVDSIKSALWVLNTEVIVTDRQIINSSNKESVFYVN